jgi:hypothetical protein
MPISLQKPVNMFLFQVRVALPDMASAKVKGKQSSTRITSSGFYAE